MKTEELIALGLTEEQAKQVFAMNGKDINALQKKISTMETEREGLNEQIKAANETIAKYDGIDPAAYREEIERYKKQMEDTEKAYGEKLMKRDQTDWLNKRFDEYGVKSPYARRQLSSDAMSAESGLSWKDGAFFGFDDFMKSAKSKDSSLYESADEKAAREAAEKEKEKEKEEQERKPGIVGKTGNDSGDDNPKKAPRFF